MIRKFTRSMKSTWINYSVVAMDTKVSNQKANTSTDDLFERALFLIKQLYRKATDAND